MAVTYSAGGILPERLGVLEAIESGDDAAALQGSSQAEQPPVFITGGNLGIIKKQYRQENDEAFLIAVLL